MVRYSLIFNCTYLHESILGLQFALTELDEIGVEHDKCGIWLNTVNFTLMDGSVSVLQVNDESGGSSSFLLSELESIDATNLLDDVSTEFVDVWSHLVEKCSSL